MARSGADGGTADGLDVAIGRLGAVMLVIGGMVGVGVFVNPAVVARSIHSPALILLAWTLGGLMTLAGAFVYAELAGRAPSTGGEYQYLRTAYGPLVAFLFGWTTLLVVHAGGMAAVAIVFARNVALLTGGAVPDKAIVVATLAVLALVNCLGVKAGDRAQTGLGILKILAIAALILAGLAVAPHTAGPATPPATPLKGFGAALIPIAFTYGGWQTLNYVAGEVKGVQRTLAFALVLGVLAVTGLYLLVNIACVRALGIGPLGATLTPAADVLSRVVGPPGGRLTAAAVALSALAFLSQGMLTGPRVIFAMAGDGLFFRFVAGLGSASRAPAAAILVLAAWTCVLALSGSYERILAYNVAMNFLFFAVTASGLFVLRRRGVGEGGFRAPGHPWTTVVFIAACVAVMINAFWSFPVDSLIGYAIMAAGLPPYFWWRSRLAARDR